MTTRPEFRNEPFLDFSKPDVQRQMRDALAYVESKLGRQYRMVIGGKRVGASDEFASHNPADWNEVVSVFPKATPELAVKAIEAAAEAFKDWSRTTPEKRAALAFEVADMLRAKRNEFSALMVYETGKSWVEADADTAEAIDLIEFYGHEALRYGGEQPITRLPSEDTVLKYIPLGVGAVIPPWNFPVAIMMGMTTAAWVAGNTVVLKPSSDAPTCAKWFVRLLEEAGLPEGVVNLLTGSGGDVGEVLVAHPLTRFISFTGSKEVGLRINELAARHQPGQIWIKRVVAEMGGKNAIIVDDEADVEAAALGVMVSAYGFQGQKCSACSRAVIVNSVYDEFVDKLITKTKAIKVGVPKEPDVYMGPVINPKAMAQIMDYVEMGKREHELLLGGNKIASPGCLIEPTIFGGVDRFATIAQEEIFGPVLAIIRAEDFEDALDIVNCTEYGLTGSVYSTNRRKLEKAANQFHVGNLYFNRKSTGAMVGVHPFGGFNMSGTDSKAGGRDYLLLFSQAKSISEKIA
ncbi:MAG: L-glutamate gamma-semialdehyde dehydrogenase [Armatimonadetes bacterium RBG_16_58_9]|nr:MAG: L-glutamate gamma-semialdehyde dehydrogenase [Armatimonadetes bacterium RBG_16_58_9]